MHRSFVNRTLVRLHLKDCTFVHVAPWLVLRQFQGLKTLSLDSCYGPVLEQRGPWFELIRGLPYLRWFRCEASITLDHPSSQFYANAMLSGVALALPLRDQPLDLDLLLNPATRFAPSLEDLVRESRGSLKLAVTQFPTTHLRHICVGLKAQNCQLHKLHLTLGLVDRQERDLARVFEAAQSCRHLQSLTLVADHPDGLRYILDDGACQALSDLLQSSAVLTTLHLQRFSLPLEGFGRVISVLAACNTAIAVDFMNGYLPPSCLALLRSRLDDMAQLEELVLDVADMVGSDFVGFLREASQKSCVACTWMKGYPTTIWMTRCPTTIWMTRCPTTIWRFGRPLRMRAWISSRPIPQLSIWSS